MKEWAKENGGTVEIGTDIVHVFALLQTKPGGFRAILHWRAEDKRGEYEEAGQVDEKFWVVLSFGRSLALNKGDALVDGQAGGGKAIFDLVEECRDLMRGLDFDADTTEGTVDYKGARPFEVPSDTVMDAVELEFWIGNQLPAVDPG